MNKYTTNKFVILALFGVITFSQANQRVVRNNEQDLYNLDDDDLIINTPQDLEDLENISVGKLHNNQQESVFMIDDDTPIKDGLFFMEDDFFHEVHQHADPPLHPHKYVEPEPIQMPKTEAELLLEQQKAERLEKEQKAQQDVDEEIENKVIIDDVSKSLFTKYHITEISDNRRPIYGVLTEPIRGTMKSKSANLDSEDKSIDEDELLSYIPKAHVQFLEQSGIRVVPISYLDSREDIISMLGQINGIYCPGDSIKAIVNKQYQKSFSTILKYMKTQNELNDYFPMFMMGKSSQVFISQVAISNNVLHNMKSWTNKNTYINLLQNHDETFLLHQLAEDQSISHAFDLGEFFNRQQTGFRMKEIQNDEILKKFMTPIATFEDSANADYEMTMIDRTNQKYKPEYEFVAIAEGNDLPFYIFTYNIEMTQFVYTDLMVAPEQQELIDKSIPTRHHAQFISQQIADEGRMNNHNFTVSEKEYNQLIRHHKIATVEYQKDHTGEHTVGGEQEVAFNTPKGLEKHDVYLIEHKKEELQEEETNSESEDNDFEFKYYTQEQNPYIIQNI